MGHKINGKTCSQSNFDINFFKCLTQFYDESHIIIIYVHCSRDEVVTV